MALCKPTKNIEVRYECAAFCDKWNDLPIPSFKFVKFKLIQNSTFFDSGIINNRQFKWTFESRGYEIYNTDWGIFNNSISGLIGSTYGVLDLGLSNIKVINFLSNLPSIQILTTDPITITLSVKDCDGFENKILSNKYKFNKK